MTATFLVNDEEEHRSLLHLQVYNFANVGVITNINDVTIEAVNEVYQLILFEPDEEYDQNTFNRNKMKSEFWLLFEFIHNVFFSYIGSNESITLPKFRVLIAVVK